MKNFLEKAKDILYDSIDYIIMLAIIVAVVFVIGWRLDVLFADDAHEPDNEDTVIVDNSTRPEPNDNMHKPNDVDNPDTEDNPENVKNEVVNIKIPDGSLPDRIGNILVENGIISSSKDFVTKAIELNLETKLRSGSFDIPKDSSVEQIVKIIANR